MKNTILLFFVFFLSSCAQVQHYYKPLLNEIDTKEVGETLIQEGFGTSYDCSYIMLENEFEVEGSAFTSEYHVKIPAGIYRQKKLSSKGFFVSSKPLSIMKKSKINKNESFDNIVLGIVIPNDAGQIYVTPSMYNLKLIPIGGNKSVNFKMTKEICYDETLSQRGFRRELVYNGGSGSVIILKYREFIDDFARPAFTQDLTYDLSKSEIIGFKGARIHVLEADNIKIKYNVLSYFD